MVLLGVAGAAAAAEIPVAVSPGHVSSLVAVEVRCPTFSWGEVEGAGSYELVVYRLDEEVEERAEEEPVLRRSFPGSVESWTPSLDSCLVRGGHYAWSVRAVRETETAEWSAPSLFEVAAGPSEAALEAALEVVRRYIGAGELAGPMQASATGAGSEAAPVRSTSASGPAAATTSTTAILSSATTAIRGEIGVDTTDTTAEVIGVAGIADSSGGAGVLAANLSPGGADLVLDGSAESLPDTILTESGLRAGGTSFAITSGAGTGVPLNLTLNGSSVTTAATDRDTVYGAGNQLGLDLNSFIFHVLEGSGSGLDADLLDGLEAAAFALGADTYSMTEVDALLTVDNLSAPIPSEPVHLRIGPEYRFPGMQRLSWNMASLSGATSFVVYQADSPIADANKASAHRMVTTSLYAAVDLLAGSGVQYFRVEARNTLEEAGPLSVELTVDTTPRLAYIADQRVDELFELFVVSQPGGGTSTRVSDDLITFGDVTTFAWSPDGSHLAYLADQNIDGVVELYVVAATGGGASKVNASLLGGGSVLKFAWSPDGSRLAYNAPQDTVGVYELYVASAGAGTSTKVNDPLVSGGDVGLFAWSPDGSALAYRADQETDDVLELYVVAATGGGATRVSGDLVSGGDVEVGFAWSPDGSRLAYTADQQTDGVSELYVAPALGGGATRVSGSLVVGGDIDSFAWSPDGSRLAYRADQEADEVFELYVALASVLEVTKVAEAFEPTRGDILDFSWSLDGSRLAYRSDSNLFASTALYVGTATGAGGGVVVSDGIQGAGDVVGAAWSPDGALIAYRADGTTDDTFELYVVPAVGGGAVGGMSAFGSRDVTGFDWSADGLQLAVRSDRYDDDVFELSVKSPWGNNFQVLSPPLIMGGDVTSSFAWSPLGFD